jgi:GDP-4-dehydro-6-deoxy-D-mannose reductase
MSSKSSKPASRWLITGARGFVGTHLVKTLAARGDVEGIWGIDRPSIAKATRPPLYTASLVSLHDVPGLTKLLKAIRPSHVVHLAAESSVAESWHRPVHCFHNNTNIFLNLAEAIRISGVPCRLLSVGSSEAYGPRTPAEMPLKESDSVRPANPYAVARVSQELLSGLYHRAYELDIVCTRSFNHCGPDQPDRFVISSFCKQAVEVSVGQRSTIQVGNLDVVRDFVDVRDVVSAYILLLERGSAGATYNVCSGVAVSLRAVLDQIVKLVGGGAPIEPNVALLRPTDNPIIVGDPSRLRDLGFRPRVAFLQSLKDQLATWRSAMQ